MTRLTFDCAFTSLEMSSVAIPVEIRNSNLAFVARTISTDSITVTDPGTYHIVATLPAGQELYNAVTIDPGDSDKVVTLSPAADNADAELEAPRRASTSKAFLAWRPRAGRVASSSATARPAKLRVFGGNLLRRESRLAPAPGAVGRSSGQVWGPPEYEFYIRAGDVSAAQLLQPSLPPVNVLLPVTLPTSPSAARPMGCWLVLVPRPDDQYWIEVHLENLVGDALLSFFERGQFDRATTQTMAPTLDEDRSAMSSAPAASALSDRVRDPISAAVAAYALLRTGELDRLHAWTANLRNWFTWLPDGLVIRAEHLARVGDHDGAMRGLLEIPARGLPIFTDGLSYAIDRLRLYLGAKPSHFSAEDLRDAASLVEKLQAFASFADLRRPVLTYTGLDPTEPDDKPIGPTLDAFDGLNIGEVLA